MDEPKAIADGPRILDYVRETAIENGIDSKIRFDHRVRRASWSSPEARWTVEPERTVGEGATEVVRFTCNFLFMCSGYYKYEEGYTPEFSGAADFTGRIVHPQKWPEDMDYAGKRVVVIGWGATAVTLVPEMARTAAHVTMLQRSPTYVVARPAEDELANKLRRNSPPRLAYHLIRWRNVLFGMYFFQLCRRKPDRAKQLILGGVKRRWGRNTTSASTSRRATIRGISGSAWCPMATCSSRSATSAPRWSPARSRPSPGRNQAQGRQRTRRRHHRHGDRAEPAGARRN